MRETGLLRAPDSPAKFNRIYGYLEFVLKQAEKRDFSEDATPLLEAIYGKDPTDRGAEILSMYRHLVSSNGELRQKAAADQPGNGDEDTIKEEYLLHELHRTLLEESQDITEKYEIYLREQVEITPAMLNACLAPTEDVWRLLMRQENTLDRQID